VEGTIEGRLPNFLYIGPDKAGSSWLHEVLIRHPQVFLSEAKDLYFFDRYYSRGLAWYAEQFRKASPAHQVVGEVCQDYLFSAEAPGRIHQSLGAPRMMVTLRDPVDRAFSSYLYMHKHGEQPGTFREALAGRPELLEHGRYASSLRRFLEFFDPDSIYVAVFDDLVADPQAFIDALTTWLGLEPMRIDPDLLEARLPAAKARFVPLARLVRQLADWARRHDAAELVGRVKRAKLVQNMLYTSFGEARPQLSEADRDYVRAELATEIADVEGLFGLDLRGRWGWPHERNGGA
jgi:hypothetical protein